MTSTLEVRISGIPAPRGTRWQVFAGRCVGVPGEPLAVEPGLVEVEVRARGATDLARFELRLRFSVAVQPNARASVAIPR